MLGRRRLSRRAGAAIAAIAVVAVVVAVALLVSGTGGDSPSSARAVAAEERSAPGSSHGSELDSATLATATDGPFSRDEAGAVAAALEYASAPQAWLYLPDTQLRAVLAEVVAPGTAGEALSDEVVYDVGLLRDELEAATGTVWFVVAPLATKVERYSDDRATVAVWYVGVLSADDVVMPHSGWHTVTFELVWHDRWRAAARSETEGPVPQLEAGQQPWSAHLVDDELAGFHRVGET